MEEVVWELFFIIFATETKYPGRKTILGEAVSLAERENIIL